MTRADTLRLLLMAEVPRDLESIEATLQAIAERIDLLDPNSDMYVAVHARLDELLAAREELSPGAGSKFQEPGH